MGGLAFRRRDSRRAVEWAEQARLHAERLAADPALKADGRVLAVTATASTSSAAWPSPGGPDYCRPPVAGSRT